MRLGQLLPTMDPAEVAQRAEELRGDAYEFEPEDAAEIYALELPPLESGSISDYETVPKSAWVLGYSGDHLSNEQRQRAIAAAQAVLDAAGVTPHEAFRSEWRLEGWDIAGFPDELALTPRECLDHEALCDAQGAANRAIRPDAPYRDDGRLEVRWPSKVRFEAARDRWLQRQAKVNCAGSGGPSGRAS